MGLKGVHRWIRHSPAEVRENLQQGVATTKDLCVASLSLGLRRGLGQLGDRLPGVA